MSEQQGQPRQDQQQHTNEEEEGSQHRRRDHQAISSFFYASHASSNSSNVMSSQSQHQYPSQTTQTTDQEPCSPQRMAIMGGQSLDHNMNAQLPQLPDVNQVASGESANSADDVSMTQTLQSTASHPKNNNPHNDNNNNDNINNATTDAGGRLWKLAGEEARHLPGLAETFMQKTRSRAVPDANVGTPEHQKTKILHGTVRMSGDTKAILMNTGPAHRRVRVVQLLVVGILGWLCWMGNFFVTTSCHFANVHNMSVGQYSMNSVPLHYGLYKYSPADSALAGYTYCYPYNSISAWQVAGRILNALALLCGTFSLVVLWWYLIAGRASPRYWWGAVRCGWVACVFQIAVNLSLVHMCRNNNNEDDSSADFSCRMGPASWGTIFTGVAWGIVGLELSYLQPNEEEIFHSDTSTIVTSLEMVDLGLGFQDYMERAFGSHTPKYSPPAVT